jgi:hypothetical protein
MERLTRDEVIEAIIEEERDNHMIELEDDIDSLREELEAASDQELIERYGGDVEIEEEDEYGSLSE